MKDKLVKKPEQKTASKEPAISKAPIAETVVRKTSSYFPSKKDRKQ